MNYFKCLIPQNIAFENVKKIGVYDTKSERLFGVMLGKLAFNNPNEKLYSFGALSDVHIVENTAESDFQTALQYLNSDENVEFTCICGDLTNNGTDEELSQYQNIVNTYSNDTYVYAISGNHEAYSGVVTDEKISQYTGQPLYYSFNKGNDVFVMCGVYDKISTSLFADGELQWLYETLEENRNKRCFVFFHVFPWGDCGNAGGIYPYNIYSGTQGDVFQSLMKHYKNVTLFHGHSHLKFYLQEIDDKANYSDSAGYRSVHIPSISVPRDLNGTGDGYESVEAESEGYVVDVYENGIHLRGRDFVKGEFLPIASYWLDTTLQTIEPNTYTDATGTINT